MTIDFFVGLLLTVPLAIAANIVTPYVINFFRSRSVENKKKLVAAAKAELLIVKSVNENPSFAIIYFFSELFKLAFLLPLLLLAIFLGSSSLNVLTVIDAKLASDYLFGSLSQVLAAIFHPDRYKATPVLTNVLSLVLVFGILFFFVRVVFRVLDVSRNAMNFPLYARKQKLQIRKLQGDSNVGSMASRRGRVSIHKTGRKKND